MGNAQRPPRPEAAVPPDRLLLSPKEAGELLGISEDSVRKLIKQHEIPVLEGGRSALDIARRLILEVTDSTRVPCQRIAESHGFRLATVEEGHPASNLLFAKPDA